MRTRTFARRVATRRRFTVMRRLWRARPTRRWLTRTTALTGATWEGRRRRKRILRRGRQEDALGSPASSASRAMTSMVTIGGSGVGVAVGVGVGVTVAIGVAVGVGVSSTTATACHSTPIDIDAAWKTSSAAVSGNQATELVVALLPRGEGAERDIAEPRRGAGVQGAQGRAAGQLAQL